MAESKMCSINKMKDEIAYSIHTLDKDVNKTIMGKNYIPNWENIIPKSGDNVRISIVLTRYNINEIENLIKYISKFDNVRYIQIRRISTETRYDELKEDIELYEKFYSYIEEKYKENRIDDFYKAQRYIIEGKEVNFWRTIETSINSLNYFTDGTCSDKYFIVEGYLEYMNK